MLRLACLFLLAGVALGSGYGYQKPKTIHCFMCEYRPPKTYSYKVPREEEYEVKVPKHTQECKEEKVLSGQRYVEDKKEEKKDDYAHGAHGHGGYGHGGYGHGGYGHGGYGHGGHGYQQRSYGHYEPVYKTVKRCYPKVTYETETRKRTVYDTETKTGPAGGFDPCMGPITAESGKADGVDDWECHSSCFTRVDHYGNVARGCFKGEFGVDPHNTAPQTINGQTYRFCYGDHCNGAKVAH